MPTIDLGRVRGDDATINGFNAVEIKAGEHISITQSGSKFTFALENNVLQTIDKAVQQAQNARDDAEEHANNAREHARDAAIHATDANNAKSEAQEAKDKAERAKDNALDARDDAEYARDQAEVYAKDAQTFAKRAEENINNKNHIINWNFANPVNRNGKTKYGESQYCIDNWYNRVGTSVSLEDNGLKLSVENSGNYRRMTQMLEKNSLLGRTITISALVDDISVGDGIFEIDVRDADSVSGTTSMATFLSATTKTPGLITATVTMPTTIQLSNLIFVLTFNLNTPNESYVKIRAVKLEFGSVQTLAHQDEDGNWVLNEIPDYAEQYTICSQYSLTTGEFVGSQNVNKNILINYDFTNPVNRNGKTEYNSSGYTIDRWKKTTGTSATLVVAEEGLTAIGANAMNRQLKDDIETYYGKTLTYSVLYKNRGLTTLTFNLEEGIRVSTNASGVAIISTVISDKREICGFYALTDDYVIAVKLELGPIQTLARQENGQWVLNEIPNYAEQYAICSQYSPITGEFVGSQNINDNILDNAHFLNPVNQIGKTEYTGAIYGIDRWHSTTESQTVKLEDGYISITEGYWRQDITQPVQGQVTISILARGTGTVYLVLAGAGSNATYSISLADSWQVISASFNSKDYNGSFNQAIIRCGAGGKIDIKAAKLEFGPVQTLAHKDGDNWVLNEKPNYALELLKCQQYQLIGSSKCPIQGIKLFDARTTNPLHGVFVYLFFPTAVPMVITPTLLDNTILRLQSKNSGTSVNVDYHNAITVKENGIFIGIMSDDPDIDIALRDVDFAADIVVGGFDGNI